MRTAIAVVLVLLAIAAFSVFQKGWQSFRDGEGGLLSKTYYAMRKAWNVLV